MSNQLVLYRKYRPQDFAAVRDQEHIVSVLKGAIAKDNIPHAILFSGTRGTGKTTMARIFAKAIGTSDVDLYEMDAASSRGIDNIRELKESAYTLPLQSPYKVYIIDEVHMLTKEAFNAFLKVLEEPPSHVVFILATTEEEKLLDTILSRCLVFRLHSPSPAILSSLVADVAKQEGFTLDQAAAELIATAADGSFRDALGITQKVILSSGDKVGSASEVATIIGAPTQDTLVKILQSLSKKDAATAENLLDECRERNVDIKLFNRLLLQLLRAVIRLRHQPDKKEIILSDFDASTAAVLETLAKDVQSSLNSKALMILLDASIKSAQAPLPYLPLELALWEVAT